jgi:hypothetical protein
MEPLDYLVILRSLYIFLLIEKGWCVRKIRKNEYEMFKSIRKKAI